MNQSHRRNPIIASPLLVLAAAAILAIQPSAAMAQVHLGFAPQTAGGGTTGLSFLPGTNVAASASLAPTTFTGSYRGDFPCLLTPTNLDSGNYYSYTIQQGYIPFAVGSLPVRISNVSLAANFKLAATGGDGVVGGGDPSVSLNITARIHQLTSNILDPTVDPLIPHSDVADAFTQNGNGLNIVDTVLPATADYIVTPGDYYIFIQARIDTVFSATDAPYPARGVTLEFGGNLTEPTYSGFNYTFGWQTVPTPGTGALLALAGTLLTTRRRR